LDWCPARTCEFMGIGASAAVLGLVVAHAVAILETVQEFSVCIAPSPRLQPHLAPRPLPWAVELDELHRVRLAFPFPLAHGGSACVSSCSFEERIRHRPEPSSGASTWPAALSTRSGVHGSGSPRKYGQQQLRKHVDAIVRHGEVDAVHRPVVSCSSIDHQTRVFASMVVWCKLTRLDRLR
jgi:hypothetical protein